MTQLYMLDTNIGSFVMRERPAAVLAKLQAWVDSRQRIVISAVTYAAMRFGSIGKRHLQSTLFWYRPLLPGSTAYCHGMRQLSTRLHGCASSSPDRGLRSATTTRRSLATHLPPVPSWLPATFESSSACRDFEQKIGWPPQHER